MDFSFLFALIPGIPAIILGWALWTTRKRKVKVS